MLNTKLSPDPAISLLGTYSGEMKTYIHLKNLDSNVHNSIIHNSPNQEATQMFPSDEWIRKIWYIHTAARRNEVVIHATADES